LTKTSLTFLGLDGVHDPHPTHREISTIGKNFAFQSLKRTKEKKIITFFLLYKKIKKLIFKIVFFMFTHLLF
jgi:hypothetical protein